MAIRCLQHIGICVADLERALRFYRDGLGFRESGELRIEGEPAATLLRLPDVALEARYLERDGVRIELLAYSRPGTAAGGSPRPMNVPGLTHLSFAVDDVRATLEELGRAGGRVLEETVIEVAGMGTVAAFCTDPDGTLVELVRSPQGGN